MQKKRANGLGYVLKLAEKNKSLLALSALFSVLSGLCTFVPYIMSYQVLVRIFDHETFIDAIIKCGITAVVSIILKFIFQILALALSHIGAFNTLYTVRSELSKHIAKIHLGFFTDNSSGEIKKIIIEDTERIEKFLAHQIPDLVTAAVVPILMLCYMFKLSVLMTASLLLPLILGFIIMAIALKITSKYNEEYHILLGRFNSSILEFINGMQVMKSFNVTARSFRSYADTVQRFHDFWIKVTKVKGAMYGIFVVLIESGVLFSLPIGGFLYLNSSLTLPIYIFFMIMSLIFLSALKNLINIAQVMNQISSGSNRIRNIMDIPADIRTDGTSIKNRNNYNVKFHDVSFAYEKTNVLKKVNLVAHQQQLTAFVGASGAGKTTAGQLIPKFWKVTEGAITIGDININDITNKELMEAVSFVFQDNFLLEDTIYENIAIGKSDAVEKEVINAARAAQIHEFIVSLPAGYQTKVGAEGTKLSGGEKQRICIARAILKNAPIIILDEATSFSDIENEYKIQRAIHNLLGGKTVIMIAHRLNTIKNASNIYVFNEGKIVEQGKHDTLIRNNSFYAKQWRKGGSI